MYFPTAGIDIAPWVPPLTALGISFFTSMGGVSGAFLLLPFQMSILGFTSPAVSATNQLFNIVAIPSGVYRYAREGRMLWPLTWTIVLGTLPGVGIGAIVRVTWLPDPRHFKLFAAAVLLYLGGRLIGDLVRRSGADESRGRGEGTASRVANARFSLRRIVYEFGGQRFEAPTGGVFLLSAVVGVVGGVYGIGGGAIIAPFLVSFFRLPVHTIAGSTLMGTLITSVAGVAFYQAIAPFYPAQAVAPDWLLGVLFGLGGLAGMYLGARTQKRVPAWAIKAMLAAVLLSTAADYTVRYFL